jgi:MoaA/NifB/PqqE/SkfB family radical SAM enzyme
MDARRWSNISSARDHYQRGDGLASGYPIEAFFEVAARCNLHCQMCAINYDSRYRPRSGRPPFFEPDLFARLRPIFPSLVRAYLFGLGEPTLNKHLVEYIRELSNAGVEVWFNTNATLIDERKADEIASAGADRITVSIDGASAEMYETIRRGARYDSVIAGIRALVKAGEKYGRPKVNLSYVAMASNLHELPDLVDLAADLGTTGVHVEPLFQQRSSPDLMDHYGRENLGILEADHVAGLFEEARGRAAAHGITVASRFADQSNDFDYIERAKHLANDWRCSEPWSSIWVTSAGEVRTCCVNETAFGNLFDETFEEIWNGDAYRRFREHHAAATATPQGCGNCIRNGRQRQSPFFNTVAPVTYQPLGRTIPVAANASCRFDTPSPGETLTDPLTIRGEFDGNPSEIELIIDETALGSLEDVALIDGTRFFVVAPMPFLTEGAHIVWLRGRGETLTRCEFFFWRPDSKSVRVTNRIIIPMERRRASRYAKIVIDGHDWPHVTWSVAANGGKQYSVADVDLVALPAGVHDLSARILGRRVLSVSVERV